MSKRAWSILDSLQVRKEESSWLDEMLLRNRECAYLKQFGSPGSLEEFRRNVPLIDYEDCRPWIERMATGEPSTLFAGRPVAFERTGGSSGGTKLIPYTEAGLADFRRELLPWLGRLARKYRLSGKAYFSISPACRKQELLAGIPVGLSDAAYLGEDAGRALLEISAVPFDVGEISDHRQWRETTLHHLRQASDLELMSVWSPTFLLRLFEGEDAEGNWPALKVISCWADAASAAYIPELQAMFPQAVIEPKGLMSTEAAVTVPDDDGRPLLCRSGFFEFRNDEGIFLEHELQRGNAYEVIATTASGLYRYRTGDMVVFEGRSVSGQARLRFIGREGLVSDLVGEKLTERFVAQCLHGLGVRSLLVPTVSGDGYLLVGETVTEADAAQVDATLSSNPQYAYARKMLQLKPLRYLKVDNLWEIYVRHQTAAGIRLGDIKPVTLRPEPEWAERFGAGV